MTEEPIQKPKNPSFSSGPCVKYPTFDLNKFDITLLGRSHRCKLAKEKIQEAIDKTRKILNIPNDYLIGIVPGSDTGAIEMAMWNLVGKLGVDVLAFESFSKSWANDLKDQLKIKDLNIYRADFGQLPDLGQINFERDVILTWNGTTSGVKIPNGDWIPEDRKGLTIVDATSAVFAMDIPWKKIDALTFSWQKVLGGEAAHGMLILSPRAQERIEEYTPLWPIPKIFQLRKKGALNKAIFEASPINTVSMLCIEDYIQALNWAESIGGLEGLIQKSQENLEVIKSFVKEHDWIEFLPNQEEIISNTSVCLKLNANEEKIKAIIKQLEDKKVADDCTSYREAPLGLRIWCGATVNKEDLKCMLDYLEWCYKNYK